MTRQQRKAHVVIWLVLTPVVIALSTLALIDRQTLPVQDPPALAQPEVAR